VSRHIQSVSFIFFGRFFFNQFIYIHCSDIDVGLTRTSIFEQRSVYNRVHANSIHCSRSGLRARPGSSHQKRQDCAAYRCRN